MLVPGNTKLGPLLHSFSMPAGVTCPGKTELCAKFCYATLGHFRQHNVRSAYRRNEEASRSSTFVRDMVTEIKTKKIKIVRIHSSGDFYNAAYIRKWVKIAKRFPTTTFYAYTRSWRTRRLLPALQELAKLKNVHLWWSCDAESHQHDGRPPRWRNVRVAWMHVDANDAIPSYVHLVFRVSKLRPTTAKYIDGRLVCPVESGVQTQVPITCTTCKLCYGSRPIPQKSVSDNKNQLPLLTCAQSEPGRAVLATA